jgi:hypothetical protein
MRVPRSAVVTVTILALAGPAGNAFARAIADVPRPVEVPADPQPTTNDVPPTTEPVEAALDVELLNPQDRVQLSKARVVAGDLNGRAIVRVTVSVSSDLYERTAHLGLVLPRGTAVVAMEVVRNGLTVSAEPRDAAQAHVGFQEAVARAIDPVLLERGTPNGEYDQYDLAIYPVSFGEPAAVTVTLSMPAFDRLVSWFDDRSIEVAGGTPAPPQDAARLASGFHVSAHTSLVAEPDGPPPTRTEIAHAFELATPLVRTCREDSQHRGALAVRFVISADGVADRVTTNGDADITACVTNIVASWRFAPAKAATTADFTFAAFGDVAAQ